MLPRKNKAKLLASAENAMTLSLHNMLQARVYGSITTENALQMCGATSKKELYDQAVACDVSFVSMKPMDGETDDEFIIRFLRFHAEWVNILNDVLK
jgi:hypothetical protein